MEDVFDIDKLRFYEKYARTRVLFALDVRALGVGVSVKLTLPAVHAAFASDNPNAKTLKDFYRTEPLLEINNHYAN